MSQKTKKHRVYVRKGRTPFHRLYLTKAEADILIYDEWERFKETKKLDPVREKLIRKLMYVSSKLQHQLPQESSSVHATPLFFEEGEVPFQDLPKMTEEEFLGKLDEGEEAIRGED